MRSMFISFSLIIISYSSCRYFPHTYGPKTDYSDVDYVTMDVIEDYRLTMMQNAPDTSFSITQVLYKQPSLLDSLTDTIHMDYLFIARSISFSPYTTIKSVILTKADVRELKRQIHRKSSYGNAQAVTPSYDLRFTKYRNAKVIWEVMISLYTNNLQASFSVPQQRQGECMCRGRNGRCCTFGGISQEMKLYLIALLEKYEMPVDRETILEMGN